MSSGVRYPPNHIDNSSSQKLMPHPPLQKKLCRGAAVVLVTQHFMLLLSQFERMIADIRRILAVRIRNEQLHAYWHGVCFNATVAKEIYLSDLKPNVKLDHTTFLKISDFLDKRGGIGIGRRTTEARGQFCV